jgi:hypothetical protein
MLLVAVVILAVGEVVNIFIPYSVLNLFSLTMYFFMKSIKRYMHIRTLFDIQFIVINAAFL